MINKNEKLIIKVLLEKNKIISSKDIACSIGISESSVKHSIKYVRCFLQNYDASLVSIPGMGFRLEIDSESKDKLIEDINDEDVSSQFHNRKFYILSILFKNKSNYTIQIFADDLNVSRHVILKDLQEIENWLDFFKIKLLRVKNKGVYIEGDEYDIRQAIIYNNNEQAEFLKKNLERPNDLDFRISHTFYNYFSKIYNTDIYEIECILVDIETRLQFHFEDVSYIQLFEYIAVMGKRIKKGNFLTCKNSISKYEVSKSEYEIAHDVVQYYAKNLNTDLDVEAHSLAVQFQLYGVYDVAVDGKNHFFNETINFLDNIQKTLVNKRIDTNNKLIENIQNVFFKKDLQSSFQAVNDRYFLKDIKKHLPYLYSIVFTNLKIIEESIGLQFIDSDVAYITMLINNCLIDINSIVNCLFITSFDENISTYQSKKITKEFPIIKIKKIINQNELEKGNLQKYDLVLTTVLLDRKEDILKISRRIDENDIKKIRTKLNKIIAEKYSLKENLHPWLKESLIEINGKLKCKDDVLKEADRILQKEGCVEEGFLKELIKREKIVSTVLGDGIAIPHVFKQHVFKSSVAIIKLDHEIEWNEGEYTWLIFVFAINTDKKSEIINFFSQFYRLFESEKLEALKDVESVDDLLCTFKQIQYSKNKIN